MRRLHLNPMILLALLGLPAFGTVGLGVHLAEQVTITGRVVDDRTGAPIAAAQVRIEHSSLGTRTNPNGEYTLRVERVDLPAGEVRLIVQQVGYRSAVVALRSGELVAQDTLKVDVRLQYAVLDLQEVMLERSADARVRRDSPLRAASPPFVAGHAPGDPPPDWNREQYAHIRENAFRSVAENPLSTFSIDVDRASYSNVRRYLSQGILPQIDAVLIEEMINYFNYDYAVPQGGHPLAVTTELGAAPWREGHQLLRIGVASPPIDVAQLPPSNLVFLIDVSGSMQGPDRLPLVKRALGLLVNELRPEDRVAIVTYAGSAGVVLQSTPGSRKERILDAINGLEAGGFTAGGAGLRLAYQIASENFLEEGNNRVILATDGDFNVGESSDAAMIRLIEELREEGTFLTILGFGTGNLQFEKMQSLAQHGNGNHAYIDSLDEARKVLVGEMGGTLVTVAQDVKIQVEFNPALVRGYRLIGYESRLLENEDFNDDTRDAGDLGAGHRVTALYEIIPVGVDSGVELRGTDPLRYQEARGEERSAGVDELAFVRIRYKEPRGEVSQLLEHPVGPRIGQASEDLTFAAAVAGFGMLLRDSEHRGSITAERVLAMARQSRGDDREGYRRGFVEMVESYRRIVAAEEG